MTIFEFAVRNEREHAAMTLADKLMLDALRASFRSCKQREMVEKTLDEINAEELACFDRAEASAINRGF